MKYITCESDRRTTGAIECTFVAAGINVTILVVWTRHDTERCIFVRQPVPGVGLASVLLILSGAKTGSATTMPMSFPYSTTDNVTELSRRHGRFQDEPFCD